MRIAVLVLCAVVLSCGFLLPGCAEETTTAAGGQKVEGNVDNSSGTEASSEVKVEIFGTSWCPYCRKAKKFFQDRGIPVVEYDIEKNREAAEVKRRLDRKPGVPFVLINRKFGFHGYAPEIYDQMLEKARNPESS